VVASDWQLAAPDEGVRRAIEPVAANAKSLRLWQLIKASGMPVYPLVILWGGSKNARPSDPLAIGETTVADGLPAVRCWIEIKRQPRIGPHDVVNKLDHQLASSVTRREENDPALLPPPSFDQVIWTCIATIASFSMTSLGCLEALTTSGAWWVGLLSICGAFTVWILVYRRSSPIRVPAIGGLVGVATVSTLAGAIVIAASLR
jgi:hypothetical protein